MSDRALGAHNWFCASYGPVDFFLTVVISHQIHSSQCWESAGKLTGASESFTKEDKTDYGSDQTGCRGGRWERSS